MNSRYFPVFLHVILFTMCVGMALGAGIEHIRPIYIGMLGGLAAGLGISGLIRLIASA
jgi:hypothetical protein